MFKSFKSWLAVTRPIQNLTVGKWLFAVLVLSIGRPLLDVILILMDITPQHYGVYSWIVWTTFWTSMFFGGAKSKIFASSVLHYFAAHFLIFYGALPWLGYIVSYAYAILWSLAMFMPVTFSCVLDKIKSYWSLK